MNNISVLFIGELQRMKKYNILSASFVLSLIWIGVLQFTDIQDVSYLFPLLIFIDVTSMAMLMIGVTMFFEKQEGVIKTLLISPISKGEYIISKTCANIISNLITLVIIYFYAKLFKEIHVKLIPLLGFVILIAFFHSMIGFVLTYYSRDFTELLIGMIKYSFILMIPVLLEQVGLIKNEFIKKLFYMLPTKAALVLLQSCVGGIKNWESVFSTLYLLIISILLYFFIHKKFDEFAIKESGV
ncbi:MAG: ABC transporter permease [Marinisporobacter sp.]|jgi:fluoroquinolone transport system permease protein|nr:ABC transporter permease [Marinisporobacter sp.]